MPAQQQTQGQDNQVQQDTAPAQQQQQQAPGQAPEAQGPEQAPELDGAQLQSAIRFNKARGYNRLRVQAIQRKLGVPPDGDFGPVTTRAIFAFQVARSNLESDGKLGPQTYAAIISTPAADGSPTAVELTPAQVNNALRFNRNRGFSRQRIIAIQEQIGVNPDGRFGPVTVGALAEWQAANGLQADGKAGQATLGAMRIDPVVRPRPRPDNLGGGQPGEDQAQQTQHGDDTEQEEEQQQQGPVPEGNITANFTWNEFRSRGDQKPVPASLRPVVTELCEQLEVIRAAFGGRSMSVNSGYRSPWWNKKVGGASNSYHKRGMAADFNVAGVRPSQVRVKVRELISQGKLKQGGVGAYATFTHYDIRGSEARWNG